MRTAVLSLAFCAALSSANIIFTPAHGLKPACDHTTEAGRQKCYRGQHCSADDKCAAVSNDDLYPRSFNHRFPQPKRDGTYSTDGTCGPNNGNTICDPKSTVYTGTCCSSYGYCGNTAAYCGQGCVSGCDGEAAPTTTNSVGSPTKAPSTTTSGEPVLGTPSTNPSAGSGADTTDGSCGASFGNTVCGNWPQGACCSLYGYCGNTTSHCGNGCQSGPCTDGPPAPGPSPAPPHTCANGDQCIGKYDIISGNGTKFELGSGVPAMHAGLMPNGRVTFLDKVENYTNLKLSNGQYAYASEYDPATNDVVPLAYKTNAFCSGGAFLVDGRFVSLGGNAPLDFDPTVGDGFNAIRYLKRSATDASLNGQDWSEPGNKLASDRWYASAQTMPDGTVFVASGSLNGLDPTVPANNNPTYEILSSEGISQGKNIPMDILAKNQPYYMYPFMHLLSDGQLFFFVSKSSEIFNVGTNTTTKTLPDLAGDYRTYPNTGGSVLLPLNSSNGYAADIVVCGGGVYQDITSPTDASCGRIQPEGDAPTWELDSMPTGRGMVEGTLLPDGTVVWLNGCNRGAQGFGLATDPTLQALIYDPTKPLGQRFTTGDTSTIARLYHSVALLLLDGTMMIAGSNPVQQPQLTSIDGNPYDITEFRVEIFTPPYLQGDNANKRPTDVVLSSTALQANSQTFNIKFNVPAGAQGVKVTLYHGGFVTHNLHMGHRMVWLDNKGWAAGATAQSLTVTMPPNHNVAQPGPYVVYVVVDGVPAIGQFVMVS